HAHHRTDGAGAACIACHMPRKNMGLGYTLTRYHRIGSPTERVRVEHDRPLECALCHADQSASWILAAMERMWGQRYDRAALAQLYGARDARVLAATLARGKPHEQAVAVALLGERPAGWFAPAIASQLTHPYPLVRYFARQALARQAGRPCPIDVDGDHA